ncbi:hypothetical protein DLM76_17140 [Leptospira yasudae]|nr:hypothetical protein [Leptospira yasudae]RHX91453.1 hypothetical protein DLM76_17140 [Leptospira yasudae]
MKIEFLLFIFLGMAVGFFFSFCIESLSPNPHEGILLFTSLSWYSSAFFVGLLGLLSGWSKWKKTS